MNITKFGAFVNILPGRDGLLHISKIGGGKRIDRVEDVLDLGDEVEVRVDDVDPNGKVSLSLASVAAVRRGRRRPAAATVATVATVAATPRRRGPAAEADDGAEREYVSFEDAFDAEVARRSSATSARPATTVAASGRGGGGGRGGDRGGRGGGGRRR